MIIDDTDPPIDLTDEPISLPEQDKLGIAPIAENLATIIREMDARKGVAFGINGSWGIGKTSLIKLVEHYVKEDEKIKKEGEENTEVEIVHFQCWWFNSEEALILNFLQTLLTSLDESLEKEGRAFFLAVGRTLSPLKSLAQATVVTATGGAAQPWVDILNSMLNEKEDKSMDALFQELSGQLAKSEKRYLVVIDDIDRLSAKEMTMMFRLVKTLGHLPNVVYLMAFDRAPAEQALKDIYPGAGPHFLEKIIQSFINIPLPDRGVLRDLLFDEVQHIFGYEARPYLGNLNLRYLHGAGLHNTYRAAQDICYKYIQTPRDLQRYKNALHTTYPAVKGKVYVADYLAIEAFRVFAPSIHAYIESEYPWRTPPLILEKTSYGSQTDWNPFRVGWEQHIVDAQLLDSDFMRNNIFPEIKNIEGYTSNKRIASPEHFRTYFCLSAEAIPPR